MTRKTINLKANESFSSGSTYIFDHSNQWRFTKFLFHNFGATKTKCLPLLSFQTIFSLKSASSLSSQRAPVIPGLPWPQRRRWDHRTRTTQNSNNEVFCDHFPMCHFHLSKLGKWIMIIFAILLDFQWVIQYSKWQVHLKFAKNYVIYANN